MTLEELEVGGSGRIVAVHGQGALRDRLLDMGLTPRTKVMIRKTAPFGDPIEISLRCYQLTLRKEDAAKIEITRDEVVPLSCGDCRKCMKPEKRFGRRGRNKE